MLGFAANYDYLIVPVRDLANVDALRCLDVVGKPAVRDYEYRFTIVP